MIYDTTGAHRPLAVLPDERLLVGRPGGGIQRYLVDGSVDPAWTDPAPAAVVREIVVDVQGQAYVLGPLEGPGKSKAVYRLAGDATGPVDQAPVFGQQPAALTAVPDGGTLVLSVTVTARPEPVLQW